MNDKNDSTKKNILKSLALRLKSSFEEAELFWNEIKNHLNLEITENKFLKNVKRW